MHAQIRRLANLFSVFSINCVCGYITDTPLGLWRKKKGKVHIIKFYFPRGAMEF